MSNAVFAHGTLLKIGDGATPVEGFTTIAEVNDLGGPSLALEAVDVTNPPPLEGWREFIGGLLDGGEVSFSINYQPTHATHNNTTGLLRDMRTRTKRNFQLVFTDIGGTTWSFTALVTGFEPGAPVDAQLTADVTLQITGKPTLI